MRTNDVIDRLDAAVSALSSVDLADLSDAAIEESLVQLSLALCRVDVLLCQLAEQTRARGFTILESGPETGSSDEATTVVAANEAAVV
jgi:hypothetical protein